MTKDELILSKLKSKDRTERLFWHRVTNFRYADLALNDKFWLIRRDAFRVLGYHNHIEKALNDKDVDIRLEAFRVLGYNNHIEKALNDEDVDIRNEASEINKIIKEIDSYKEENEIVIKIPKGSNYRVEEV